METKDFQAVTCPYCEAQHAVKGGVPATIRCLVCRTLVAIKKLRRRRHERFTTDKSARIRGINSPHSQKVRICDFSPGGARLLSKTPFEPFESIQVSTDDFVALGKTVWLRQTNSFWQLTYEAGVKFDTFKPRRKSIMLETSA